MYKRILVPVDGSETSRKALAQALQVAREADGSVRIVHVLDEVSYVSGYDYGADLMRAAREEAARVVREAEAFAKAMPTPVESGVLESPGKRLGDIVTEEARRWNADLVVVGSHGRRGMARALLGSGAEQIIRGAETPVLVIRGDDRPG